jgi:rare lipoprotein A
MALRLLPPVLALASLLAVSACFNKPEPSAPPAELVSLPPTPPPAPTFEQTGKASFYGRQFHGRTTASGEKFDMNDMTAAHRTLPMGTVVKVTNLENGRSVSVTINDRGPNRRNRVIDLSQAAASEIGLDDEGLAMVKVEAIPGEQPTQTADQSGR